jgi:dipeptidyl aminopeptidase/acylaminoacyl peptidase
MQKHVLMGLTMLSLGAYPRLNHAQNDPFTVKDSIQMAHFSDPKERSLNPPVWNTSPDGSTALFVTTKGIITSNMVESTVWTLDLKATAKYLEEDDGRTPPSPKGLFTASGQLRAFQDNSYGSLITDCRWSGDSKAVYMLLESTGGQRELDKVDVMTGRRERLSPEGYSVDNYEPDSRGLLYSAEQFQKNAVTSDTNRFDVVETVTSSSLYELLWPSSRPKQFLFRSDDSGVHRIAPALPYHIEKSFFISADGSTVITLVPVEETPIAWKKYLPGLSSGSLYQPASSLFPTLQYDVVDLRSNSRRSLLGSPSGRTQYDDKTHVVWSSGGDHALVTNTFLPFEHQTIKEQEARRRPCAAAYVGIDDDDATCIVFARSSEEHETADSWALLDIKFGRTDHDVVINFTWRGRHKTECYSLTDGIWSQNPKSACDTTLETLEAANPVSIRLEIRQSPDEPPTLWAENVKNSRRANIWNPNPQIAGKVSGTTSEYHWLDKDKREWSGELMLPEGFRPGTRLPLVIQTHGFRPTQYLADGVWTTAMAARPLVAAGFAVLQIEDKHEHSGTLEEAKIHVDGYGAAIDQLAEGDIIDPKRVGIIGFSRTCWFVEESLLEAPDRFAAAVIADGVDQSYFQYMLSRPNMPAMEAERYNGGLPIGKGLEAWIKSAPSFRLSEMKTPLRLQAIGPRSLVDEWEVYASLKIQNKAVDMVYFPLGQHVLQNPAELMASEQGDVDWLAFWLNDKVDSDPSKKTQYERWEKLRTEKFR